MKYNRVFIDVNKISTVYGKRNFRDYISKQLRLKNLVRIKNRSTESSERSAPIAESYRKDASVSSIRNPKGEVNTKFDEAQKTVETKTESEPVANDDNGDVIPFDVEQEDVQNSVSTSQKDKKCSKKSIVKTFRNGQNAKGEFMANVLIDLADLNSEWWTGGYNYDMLGVSKTDDTEFRQFHQEIEKRTKDMDEYGKSTQPAVSTSFTIHDGSGKEYIYRVLLDGYLHGVVLGKIDKAKYDAFVKKYEGGETHGRTIADTVRRVSRTRTELGRKDTGSSWGGKSDGNSGSGRVAGVSPQRDNGGNDSGGQSTNHPVSAVTTSDAMSIYCLSRRPQGLQHLLGGGVRVVGIQKGSQKSKGNKMSLWSLMPSGMLTRKPGQRCWAAFTPMPTMYQKRSCSMTTKCMHRMIKFRPSAMPACLWLIP